MGELSKHAGGCDDERSVFHKGNSILSGEGAQ
jgi:hypothetical protein